MILHVWLDVVEAERVPVDVKVEITP